jgi:hypothetical protein
MGKLGKEYNNLIVPFLDIRLFLHNPYDVSQNNNIYKAFRFLKLNELYQPIHMDK